MKLVLTLMAAAALMPGTASAQYSTPVRDVENPARSPFVILYSCDGVGNSSVECVPNTTVPAGSRYVIETTTYDLVVSNYTYVAPYITPVASISPYSAVRFMLPLVQTGIVGGKGGFSNSLAARLYSETTPLASVGANGATVKGMIATSGYLIKK